MKPRPSTQAEQALSERERRFVENYMSTANATRAARAAGYSPKTARGQGSRLLTKVNIRRAIDERTRRDPVVATRERRQRFWTSIMDDPTASMRDRLRASELLARASGDFLDRLDVTTGGQPLRIEVVTGVPERRRAH